MAAVEKIAAILLYPRSGGGEELSSATSVHLQVVGDPARNSFRTGACCQRFDGTNSALVRLSGKAAGTLDVVPLIIPADSSAARPAMLAQAKLTMTPDGKGSLTVTDVRPTVQLNLALDSSAKGKVNLSFVPVAGSNHFVEFSDGLAANSLWQLFPSAPHNSGFVVDNTATAARFYRVRIGN